MLRHLLDTNICIDMLKHRPPAAREAFNRHSEHLCISSVVPAELLYGVEKSSEQDRNRDAVEAFAARLDVVHFDDGVRPERKARGLRPSAGRPVAAGAGPGVPVSRSTPRAGSADGSLDPC